MQCAVEVGREIQTRFGMAEELIARTRSFFQLLVGFSNYLPHCVVLFSDEQRLPCGHRVVNRHVNFMFIVWFISVFLVFHWFLSSPSVELSTAVSSVRRTKCDGVLEQNFCSTCLNEFVLQAI